jgi:hypothetical protein
MKTQTKKTGRVSAAIKSAKKFKEYCRCLAPRGSEDHARNCPMSSQYPEAALRMWELGYLAGRWPTNYGHFDNNEAFQNNKYFTDGWRSGDSNLDSALEGV